MFVNVHRRRLAAGLARLPTAWVVIACLFLQLAASAACIGGSRAPGASFATGVPICHAAGKVASQDDPGRPAEPDHGVCPFCSLHCHGLAGPSLPPDGYLPARIALVQVGVPTDAIRLQAAGFTGGYARGPPAIA